MRDLSPQLEYMNKFWRRAIALAILIHTGDRALVRLIILFSLRLNRQIVTSIISMAIA